MSFSFKVLPICCFATLWATLSLTHCCFFFCCLCLISILACVLCANEVYYSLFLMTSFTLDSSAFCSCSFCCLPALSDLNKLLNAIKAREATLIQDWGGNGAIQKVSQGLCLLRRRLVKQISRVTRADIKDEDDVRGRKIESGSLRITHGTK